MAAAVERDARYFDFHGVGLRVHCTVPVAQRATANLLKPFAQSSADRDFAQIEISSAEDPEEIGDRLPASASLLYSNRLTVRHASAGLGLEFDVYRTTDRVFVDLGAKGMMVFQPADARAEVLLANPESIHVDIVGSLLLYALSELLKPRGFHLLHAAAVSLDGRAVIIPGTQGRGKTTTCLALVSGGFGFLSDDVVFLRETDGRIEVCALPEHVSVTPRTIEMFPELRARAAELEPGLLKRHARMDDLFPGATAMNAVPAILLFPEVTGEPASRLESLSRRRALEWILPRGVSVLDQGNAARGFKVLSRMVAQCACNRLAFGTNIDEVAPLVKNALAAST